MRDLTETNPAWHRCLGILIVGLALPQAVFADEVANKTLRIATFNVSLYGNSAGEVMQRLTNRSDAQATKIASIVQTVRPDILLINELDYDPDGKTAALLANNFFAVSQDDQHPLDYPHLFAVPSNTGLDSGMDINRNGAFGDPEDAFGYGIYPGQYAMAVYSRFPIDRSNIRTFQQFLWKDLPSALRPTDPATGKPYYAAEVWERLRLSSKNHVDIPIKIPKQTLHVLASHPTPPVFDGVEDHNGCRNHDEIQFWINYLNVGGSSSHPVDDQGRAGGLPTDERFVILGDLNSDPITGDSRQDAIRALLGHRRIQDPQPARGPRSSTASDAAVPSKWHTASFGRNRTMRIDYALPSRGLPVIRSGVFWPEATDRRLDASDHRLVWIELELAE